MSTTAALLTAEEYAALPPSDVPTELVRGIIEEMNVPGVRHGEVCCRIATNLQIFLDAHHLGRIVINDTGVITTRGPDTVRGADVAFYSFSRLPEGPAPIGYAPRPPEIVFEVLSPFDRLAKVLTKVREYLNVGVDVVCVVDPATLKVQTHAADGQVQTLSDKDALTFPEILEGFSMTVDEIFT